MEKKDFKLNMFKVGFGLNEKHLDKSNYVSLWNSNDVINGLHVNNSKKLPVFVLHDGPPYANGSLHLGHFANKVLKDTLLKYKRLSGYFCPYVPGFDCHGLPVELEVEKLGYKKDNPFDFVDKCRDFAQTQVDLQKAEFKDFGVSADWDNSYKTMDYNFESKTMGVFLDLMDKGFMYQKLRPVHWCSECGSSLAEYEVDYKKKKSDSVTVKFKICGESNTYLLVWTTTPYTLPANKAVGYTPKFTYIKKWDEVLKEYHVMLGTSDNEVVFPLTNCIVENPYSGLKVPLLPADYVESVGTGFVHLAPSFGTDDFSVCEKHGIYAESYINEVGRFSGLVSELEGLSVYRASGVVLEKLRDNGLLFQQSEVEHEYPHCWRHKTPLVFRSSKEWFMNLETFREDVLKELEGVSFIPSGGEMRMRSMLSTRNSWCVSRNRLWGTPLSVLLDSNGNLHPNNRELMDSLLVLIKENGLSAWYQYVPPVGYYKSNQTLDVWFDSGVTHEVVVREKFGVEADLYLEGVDQHRGWFQSSLLTSMGLNSVAPYKTVMTHGFVVDEFGKKLSKSSKNYVSMEKLFNEYSPDVLRLWVLSQDYSSDLKYSKVNLLQAFEKYKKFRNTLRFCLQNTVDFDYATRDEYLNNVKFLLNKKQLMLLKNLKVSVLKDANNYNFSKVVSSLYMFAESSSSNYFEVLKDALYCDDLNSLKRRESQAVLSVFLETFLLLLNPVLSYTAEECFGVVRSKSKDLEEYNSVNLVDFSDLDLLFTKFNFEFEDNLFEELYVLKKNLNKLVEVNKVEFPELKSCQHYGVELTVPIDVLDKIKDLSNELQDIFEVAKLDLVIGTNYELHAKALFKYKKCERCWEYYEELTDEHLCERCFAVMG